MFTPKILYLCRSSRGSVDWNKGRNRIRQCWKVAPLVGAWIEIQIVDEQAPSDGVAPLVGAWIEILIMSPSSTDFLRSLLSWERGLKYLVKWCSDSSDRRSSRGSVDWNSFSMSDTSVPAVAPLVGAWIEILRYQQPHCDSYRRSSRGSVDWNDFAGALPSCRVVSLLSWERGLK